MPSSKEKPEQIGTYVYPRPVSEPKYFYCVCQKCQGYRDRLKNG